MPPPVPTVTITVLDLGSSTEATVPAQNVQLKIGPSIGGTINLPVATSSPTTLQTNLVAGPLLEASGLVAEQGSIVIAVPCPITNKGTASAVVVTTPGGSTSVVTATLDTAYGSYDRYFIEMFVLASGTIGTAPGPQVQFSGDAGRTYGPPVSLGSASAWYLGSGSLNNPVAGGTGVQLNFAAGTLVAGDYFRLSTTRPQCNSTGVVAALAAFQGSQYGVAGVGSIHIVEDVMHGGSSTDDIQAINTQLLAGMAIYQYDRAIVELRDALNPVAWGGSGETEATWIAALQTAMSGISNAERICADGGDYNMGSAYANASFGTPEYRRNLAWAHSVVRTLIPLNQRAGRVKSTATQPYTQIVVNPATDPSDGFVYHNDLTTPGLAIARISCAQSWPKKGQGFFHSTEPLLSPPGSQIDELVKGNCMDVACDIGYAQGVEEVSDNLKLQTNGTLDPVVLNLIQNGIQQALNVGMIATPLVSNVTATISPTANVGQTGQIPIAIGVQFDGYVDAVVETIFVAQGG